MADMNDYDEVGDSAVDEDEAQAAEKGAVSSDESASSNDGVVAEAETLTVTAKLKQRQALEDEVAAFLARGGRITEVPPDEAEKE